MNSSSNYNPASATRRHLSGLADAAIFMMMVSIFFLYNSEFLISCLQYPVLTALVFIPCLGIFRFCSFIAFNGTPGMLLFQIKLLYRDFETITTNHALMASFFILHSEMEYYSKI